MAINPKNKQKRNKRLFANFGLTKDTDYFIENLSICNGIRNSDVSMDTIYYMYQMLNT